MTAEPLAGVRVLEMAAVLAGPYTGAMLQRVGAEVIKIESPDGGDPFRNWSVEGSPQFAQFNLGKKSVALDVGDPRGAEVIRRLLPEVDLLVHNSRPGRMERFGLSGPECLEINPRLVYVGMSGFGTTGPLAPRPAYDAIGQGAAGLLHLLAQGGTPFLGPSFADMATGIIAATGAMMGLASVARTGSGLVIETSMLESVTALISDAFTQFGRTGVLPDDTVRSTLSQVFMLPAGDGEHLAVHLSSSEKFFQNFARALGRDDLIVDARFATYRSRIEHYADLRAELESALAARSSAEWEAILVEADVPCSRVKSMGDVLIDEQVRHLGIFDYGDGSFPYMRAPWTFDGQRPELDLRIPRLGEHTDEILSRVVSPEELDALRRDGIARSHHGAAGASS
jgi:crotonobetainyl-CoA:carnitine CoA-transferase CaiB-like acyl-CoA transferase